MADITGVHCAAATEAAVCVVPLRMLPHIHKGLVAY